MYLDFKWSSSRRNYSITKTNLLVFSHFSPVYILEKEMEKVKEVVLDLVGKENPNGKTFKIATKRSDHEFCDGYE